MAVKLTMTGSSPPGCELRLTTAFDERSLYFFLFTGGHLGKVEDTVQPLAFFDDIVDVFRRYPVFRRYRIRSLRMLNT